MDYNVQDVIDCILNYHPPSSIWIHEKVLCRLAIPNFEGSTATATEVLTTAIKCLKKGYIGTQRNCTSIRQGPVDLEDTNNELSIVFQKYGHYESFLTSTSGESTTSTRRPRWFYYGESPALDVTTQIRIARLAMAPDEIAEQNWMKWYLKTAGLTRSYQSIINTICKQYEIYESTLRHILYYSNFVVGRTTRAMQSTVSNELTYPEETEH